MDNENNFKFLNEKLLRFRKEKGLSQEDLGNKIGVSRQAVSKWESGEITPDLNNLVLLCKVLDKKIDELLSGTDDILYDKNEIKSKVEKIKQINWKKIIIVTLCIGILLIFISVIYKCCIIYNINIAVSKNKNLKNYYYRYTDYRTNNGELTQLFKTEVYYKEGIYKRVFTNKNEIQSIIWANVNTKEGYNIDIINNTYSKLDEDDILFYANENGVYQLREPSVECENFLEYIAASVPFSRRIKNNKGFYEINFRSAVGFNENIIINKESGLPEKHKRNKDEIYEYIQYEYEFDEVLDEEIKKIDLEQYKEIINE